MARTEGPAKFSILFTIGTLKEHGNAGQEG